MDLKEALQLAALAWTLAVAIDVLAVGAWFDALVRKPALSHITRTGLVPLALASGLLVGFTLALGWPGAGAAGGAGRPWYQGEARQMIAPAAIAAGLLVPILALLPRWPRWIAWGILTLALALLLVRGPWFATDARPPWEGWGYFAAFIALLMVAFGAAFEPLFKEKRLWLVGLLVMWASSSLAGISVMVVFAQSVGRMFVFLAVMAGLAVLTCLLPSLRAGANGATLLLAALYAAAMGIAAFYHRSAEWPMGVAGFLMLAAAPLSAAAAWIPPLRRRPWACLVTSLGVIALLATPAMLAAMKTASELE